MQNPGNLDDCRGLLFFSKHMVQILGLWIMRMISEMK